VTTEVRVYLPATSAELRDLADSGALRCPRRGHVVTRQLRDEWPLSDDEELEYAVLRVAADESRPDPTVLSRRCVVVADLPASAMSAPVDLTRVEVADLRRSWLAALHIDVAEGAAADDDLAWFAPTELAHLIAGVEPQS
jgi:hypothetical protein